MLIIFGITMINNLVISALINSGQTDVIFSKVPDEAVEQLRSQLDQLQTASSNSKPLTAMPMLMGRWSILPRATSLR